MESLSSQKYTILFSLRKFQQICWSCSSVFCYVEHVETYNAVTKLKLFVCSTYLCIHEATPQWPHFRAICYRYRCSLAWIMVTTSALYLHREYHNQNCTHVQSCPHHADPFLLLHFAQFCCSERNYSHRRMKVSAVFIQYAFQIAFFFSSICMRLVPWKLKTPLQPNSGTQVLPKWS